MSLREPSEQAAESCDVVPRSVVFLALFSQSAKATFFDSSQHQNLGPFWVGQ